MDIAQRIYILQTKKISVRMALFMGVTVMSYRRYKQLSLFDLVWNEAINQEHELVQLARKIDWGSITFSLLRYFSTKGRRSKDIRLMVGLHILKHRDNLSDQDVVDKLHENVYYLYFCDVSPSDAFEKGGKILDESTMTKFRKRIGIEGVQEMESIIRDQLVREKKMSARTHIIDTTAMEKHREYPTDSSLLHKGRKKLVQYISTLKQCGVKMPQGLRSFTRISKKVLIQVNKFGKNKDTQREKGIKDLASFAKHITKRIPIIRSRARRKLKKYIHSGERKVAQTLSATISKISQTEETLKKIIHQSLQRVKGIHVSGKIYSIHEPEVTCIRKGKKGKPNEYGSKIRISMDRNGYVVSHKAYHTNIADTNTLQDACNEWKEIFGKPPEEFAGDRGFHLNKKEHPEGFLPIKKISIPPRGKTSHPCKNNYWYKRLQRLRTRIEPLISHLKLDHRMNRSRYRGSQGDQINVCLAVIAWNTKKWIRSQAA